MARPGSSMMIDSVAVALSDAESVTVTLTFVVPAVVGFPLSTPPVDRDRPAGSVEPLVTAHVYPPLEPPVAAKVVAV